MKKKKSIITEISFIIVVIVVIVYLTDSRKKLNNEIFLNGNFAIGTFTKFITQSIGQSRSYNYFYNNKQGEKVDVVSSEYLPKREQRKKIIKGDQFFVIYNDDGASIFFDRPIKDSSDFKQYINEIQEIRLQKQNEQD